MDVLTEAVKQVPALAVLVFVVIYFLRYIERLSAQNADRDKEIAETYAKACADMAEKVEASTKVNARLTQVVLFHDATVKGENPEAFGSPQDLIKKILE